ncbi:MAG: hypothetical protein KGN80_01830 [Acidobacteriota bacterium]|nr:hypothetical protein [Acidobacteriota bacterium]
MVQQHPAQGPPRTLPYRRPQEGRDYWIQDDFLPNALAVSERCFAREDWTYGFPHRPEFWPGMRAPNGLLAEELERVGAWVKEKTGAKKLWQETTPEGAMLNHNWIQLVGEKESGPRPHTDSRRLCRYAGVIYLSPKAPARAGTSFYRLRLRNGALSGNFVPPPHANIPEALGVAKMPLDAWSEDLRVDNVFNRLIVYRADLVHSATSYCGVEHRDKRMTIVFFWMA